MMDDDEGSGPLYRGGLSARTSARLAKAILREFGPKDGGIVLDWLIDMIQAATPTKGKGKGNG
jgi:hypothetical protein